MFIIGSLPQSFDGFLRREYTRNLQDGHGDYYPVHIHGLRVVRGSSLQLQCVFTERYSGAGFLAPIEALSRQSGEVSEAMVEAGAKAACDFNLFTYPDQYNPEEQALIRGEVTATYRAMQEASHVG